MNVLAVRAWPGLTERAEVQMDAGARIEDLRAKLGWDEANVAVFGVKCGMDRLLQEGDRVEFLRPLTADPKDARRRRADLNPLPRTFRAPKKIRQRQSADSDSGEGQGA